MSALGAKLRVLGNGGVAFWCPGCGEAHAIYVEPPTSGAARPVWGFNGDGDRPTFTPSVLVRSGHFVPGWESRFPEGVERSCWCTYNEEHPDDADFHCQVCHSFVTDGQIQFLSDCTHVLAGQTVPLPDWTQL
jgi:hypothetical protein